MELSPHARMLVVDDMPLIALDLKSMLSNAFGCTVEMAVSRDALGLLRERVPPFDVVVVATDVPADHMRMLVEAAENKRSEVVFSSAYESQKNGVKCFPGRAVLEKPFHQDTVFRTIGPVLETAIRQKDVT